MVGLSVTKNISFFDTKEIFLYELDVKGILF